MLTRLLGEEVEVLAGTECRKQGHLPSKRLYGRGHRAMNKGSAAVEDATAEIVKPAFHDGEWLRNDPNIALNF